MRALRVGRTRGDQLELTLRWPRPKDRAARKRVAELRKKVTRVLGRKLVFAIATEGEVMAVALGKGYRKVLGQMLAVARGDRASTGTEKIVQKHLTAARMSAFAYVPVASLVEQVMRVVTEVTRVPNDVKDMVQKVLPGPGNAVPVTATVSAEGRALKVDARISPELVGMGARAFMGMLQRQRGRFRMP